MQHGRLRRYAGAHACTISPPQCQAVASKQIQGCTSTNGPAEQQEQQCQGQAIPCTIVVHLHSLQKLVDIVCYHGDKLTSRALVIAACVNQN
jgi:hypothetical protein